MEGVENSPADLDATRQKQAACLECRRSKTKCVRAPDDSICKKCRQSGSECVIPEYHVGRYKGVKKYVALSDCEHCLSSPFNANVHSKRSGLEKAIAQVEQAIKRSRTSENGIDDSQAHALQMLLKDTSASSPITSQFSPTRPPLQRAHTQSGSRQKAHAALDEKTASFADNSDDGGDVTVNNADNPLQLLAIASAIPEQPEVAPTPPSVNRTPGTELGTVYSEESDTQAFFKPLKSKLDVNVDLDPIELGLVTDDEAQRLFTYFHDSLAHTRWGMDSNIHTAAFVCSRSAFLFTSVMAASALFLPDTAALSQRLQNHVRKLVQVITAERYRSMEIVLAFMVNIPWMVPGRHWAEDDETCYYLNTALTVALDLQLNKIVTPSSTMRPPGFLDRVAKADCIDAHRALLIDSFTDIDPLSVLAKQLLRTRERTWLALFNLDRGVCLARGRPPTVPTGPLLDSCDSWHISEISERQDGPLISSTVLRRDIVGLVSSVRSTCDSIRLTVDDSSEVVKFMKDKIEKFFEHWFATWSYQIQQPNGSIPPYVEILASHTKLSAYCNVINHPTASVEVKQFFRAAGLATALNVMRVAVQSEPRMKSMPNNIVIMVSFAACFVMGLGTSKTESKTFMAGNTRPLIKETAEVLERIGSIPEHRRGASVLFGKHLKTILRQSKSLQDLSRLHRRQASASQENTLANAVDHYAQEVLLRHNMPVEMQQPGPYHIPPESYSVFDMTDDQLLEAIANSRTGFDQPHDNFLYDENQFLNWFESWG